ncbi:MAG TPA: ribosome-associated translation inhibitor RaiA [Candidatus Dojkabacteria bacterium]|nr:ribosome-associated translation inhibitor RaiA [Candidatus Dojkabacteria bacterium]HOF79233.1 ribosome-associated translation inhibitor RaiA [Candidatus Dojkabacteria bacterium]HQI92912.1 ribosome-associated translation inhibitor RaiA [Candidatus Dojkabacteria bacterium]
MEEKDIQVSFVGMDPTEALKKYVLEKIMKKENLFTDATSIEVFFKEFVHSKGVKHDFRVDINVKLPNTVVRVEESGSDMYANIDKGTDTLFRRLKRYNDKKEYWEGKASWKILEAQEAIRALEEESGVEVDDYSDYIPKIAKRKIVEDMSPIEEGEAIERMELSGYDQYLFRNKSNNKICMLYKRKQGGYGLVEPKDGI